MKTILIAVILVSLMLLSAGCNESVKGENAHAGNQIARKNHFDPVGDVRGLCRGTIFLTWDVITLGYDRKDHGRRKQEVFTYRQANNVGLLQFLGCLTNGHSSGNYYGAGYHASWNDRYRDRGYRQCYGQGFGHNLRYKP